jgi:hypothetical protein
MKMAPKKWIFFAILENRGWLVDKSGLDTSEAFSWGIQVKDLGRDFRTYSFSEI